MWYYIQARVIIRGYRYALTREVAVLRGRKFPLSMSDFKPGEMNICCLCGVASLAIPLCAEVCEVFLRATRKYFRFF